MQINIKTIPGEEQRYPTAGDYWIEDGVIQVRVTHTRDVYDQAIIIHELFELFSVMNKNIDIKKIDDFDIAFEKLRDENPEVIGDSEPGDMVSAPYYEDHQEATKVEKAFIAHNGVDWDEYDEDIKSL